MKQLKRLKGDMIILLSIVGLMPYVQLPWTYE